MAVIETAGETVRAARRAPRASWPVEPLAAGWQSGLLRGAFAVYAGCRRLRGHHIKSHLKYEAPDTPA